MVTNYKVIIIGHSLGGLLARAYLTYFNPSNVDKLIMIGTPNFGAVNAYYFWSGGKVPYSKIEDNVLYKSKDYLSKILGRPIMEEVEIEDIDKVEVVLSKKSPEIEIIKSDKGSQTIDLGNGRLWIMTSISKDLKT